MAAASERCLTVRALSDGRVPLLTEEVRSSPVWEATCNRTPEEFSRSTLHREHPQARFTERIRHICDTAHLRSPGDAPLDYRATLTAASQPSFLSPLDQSTEAALESRFALALGSTEARSTVAQMGHGRSLEVVGSHERGIARISFAQLW